MLLFKLKNLFSMRLCAFEVGLFVSDREREGKRERERANMAA